MPYFSASVKSTKFLDAVVMKLLPHYYELPELSGADVQDQLCKVTQCAVQRAEYYLPLSAARRGAGGDQRPPGRARHGGGQRVLAADRLHAAAAPHGGRGPGRGAQPGVHQGEAADRDNVSVLSTNNYLLQVECLMFAFHAIGRQDETFLKSDEERLKDFRSRLQYLARGVQGYIKKLKEVLAKPAPGTSHEDRQIKQIALRTNENIQTMIRDLFHSPPIYKANITLSFKPKQDKAKDAGGPKPGQKRKPITFTKAEGGGGAGGKRRALYMDTVSGGGAGRSYNKPHVSSYKPPGKQARPSGHYAPPGGKFSGKIKDRRGSWSNN